MKRKCSSRIQHATKDVRENIGRKKLLKSSAWPLRFNLNCFRFWPVTEARFASRGKVVTYCLRVSLSVMILPGMLYSVLVVHVVYVVHVRAHHSQPF